MRLCRIRTCSCCPRKEDNLQFRQRNRPSRVSLKYYPGQQFVPRSVGSSPCRLPGSVYLLVHSTYLQRPGRFYSVCFATGKGAYNIIWNHVCFGTRKPVRKRNMVVFYLCEVNCTCRFEIAGFVFIAAIRYANATPDDVEKML